MTTGLRRLAPREHVRCAAVLVIALTMIAADRMLADAARLESAGRSTAASALSMVPALAFVVGLFVLWPRTGNDSRHALFRLAGRLPLLVRYVVLGLFVYGLAAAFRGMG
jgi:hypothetical protein